ncbi:hypothetical protein C2869_04740 [Saccharobesus litoralis]|uniref:SapC protein n=1 Tax=Saccharobesus litoralis TaxID=2172099 RepID=A0A2S0VNL0_9ALTE|nr:SapC family protein [Saccharobesus litoralis]AWB65786.1 hypothetical protein C2869_04740 [Saccharobesus litoralis]
MTDLKPEQLDPKKHSQIYIDTTHYDTPNNHVNSCVVTVAELANLVHEYPIFITKNNHSGLFQLSALFGLKSGENLYLQDNSWRAKYLPMEILRRPIQLAQDENDPQKATFALDMNSPQINNQTGERLFTDNGAPTDYLQRIQTMFSQLISSSQQTQKILQTAAQYDLIEPVELNIKFEGQEQPVLGGLYSVKAENLNTLTGEALETCHKTGVLQICHLLLITATHLDKLVQWANERNKAQ